MKPDPFTHCVFDAYGTLFDVHSAVGRYREVLGEKADPVSILWRTKQLEYTWLRSLMRQHVDFWQITSDALEYAFSPMKSSIRNCKTNCSRPTTSWTVTRRFRKP
ncbi:MAG: HAD-IA family hydrolase [SAR324 cluster bacterium]|nr:HAD-IA family hydrolase [SAR324 cluster bacterium]